MLIVDSLREAAGVGQWHSVLSQILCGPAPLSCLAPTSSHPPLSLSLNNLDEYTGGWFIELVGGINKGGDS